MQHITCYDSALPDLGDDTVLKLLARLLMEWTWLSDMKPEFRVQYQNNDDSAMHPYPVKTWSKLSDFCMTVHVLDLFHLSFKRQEQRWLPVNDELEFSTLNAQRTVMKWSKDFIRDANERIHHATLARSQGIGQVMEIIAFLRRETHCAINTVLHATSTVHCLRHQCEQLNFRTFHGLSESKRWSMSNLETNIQWRLDIDQPSISAALSMRGIDDVILVSA